MFRQLQKWVDDELAEVGLRRKDLRINFRFRGRMWYIETFNPLWWFLVVVGTVAAAASLYVLVVAAILLWG